jgi:uncharacterized protein (AIM24 family)
LAGRVLLPQENFLAAGPGVKHAALFVCPGAGVCKLRPDGLMLMLAEGDGWVFSGGQGEVSEVALARRRNAHRARLRHRGAVGDAGGGRAWWAQGPGWSQARRAMAALRGPGRVWLQSCGEQADANAVQAAYMRLSQNRPAGLPGR